MLRELRVVGRRVLRLWRCRAVPLPAGAGCRVPHCPCATGACPACGRNEAARRERRAAAGYALTTDTPEPSTPDMAG
jgi:hypothetical protein